jgi:hypothetical protein
VATDPRRKPPAARPMAWNGRRHTIKLGVEEDMNRDARKT